MMWCESLPPLGYSTTLHSLTSYTASMTWTRLPSMLNVCTTCHIVLASDSSSQAQVCCACHHLDMSCPYWWWVWNIEVTGWNSSSLSALAAEEELFYQKLSYTCMLHSPAMNANRVLSAPLSPSFTTYYLVIAHSRQYDLMQQRLSRCWMQSLCSAKSENHFELPEEVPVV